MLDAMISLPAVAFAVALVGCLALTPLIRSAALRRGIVDEPGGRKIHTGAVPLLGGLAIGAAVYLAVAAAVVVGWLGPTHPDAFEPLPAILVGAAILLAAGLIDDLRGLSPARKLVAQALAAVVAIVLGLNLTSLSLPWGVIELGALSPVVTLVWVLVVVNAINLIDGLDGLAAGVVLIALAALFAVTFDASQPGPLLALAAAAGAAGGFLVFNFHPARIIMGDAGSMFLGFLVAGASLALLTPAGGNLPPWVPLVALGLPIADMAWAVIRRALERRPIFGADAGHLHHRLLAAGMEQRRAVLLLYGVSALLALLAIALARAFSG